MAEYWVTERAANWALLRSGDFFGLIEQAFENAAGPFGVFLYYGMFYSLGLGLVYIKTKDPLMLGIAFMLTSAAMIPLVPPQTQIYFIVALVLSLSIIIYQTFKGGRFG